MGTPLMVMDALKISTMIESLTMDGLRLSHDVQRYENSHIEYSLDNENLMINPKLIFLLLVQREKKKGVEGGENDRQRKESGGEGGGDGENHA